jgi:hypothetical protein
MGDGDNQPSRSIEISNCAPVVALGGLALFGPYQPSMPARRELPFRAQQFFISGHLRSFIGAVYGVETGRTSLHASSQLKEPGSRGSPKTVAGPATIAEAKLQRRQWAP